jgi:hypothetical protein
MAATQSGLSRFSRSQLAPRWVLEEEPFQTACQRVLSRRTVSTYRLFISHRYAHSEEYRRLVRMLDSCAAGDPKWRWKNYSVPMESPIMSRSEAGQAEIYEARLRERLSHVHAVLYVLRDDWLEEMGSLYHELVEATVLRYGTQVPIISVLPRGASPQTLQYGAPGVAVVRWHSPSIVSAVREYALPVSSHEIRLTSAESADRARIVESLQSNAGRIGKSAAALGISKQLLRQKILTYVIR